MNLLQNTLKNVFQEVRNWSVSLINLHTCPSIRQMQMLKI